MPLTPFADLLEANAAYVADHDIPPTGVAARGLAILTCIDSRIDPLAVFGLVPGDAKILRNAGARVTDDAIRSLALAVATLGVTRIAVVQHTNCALASNAADALVAAVQEATGTEHPGFDPLAIEDQEATVLADAERVRRNPLIADGVVVGAFVLHLDTGKLVPVEASSR
ncbi:MAG: carbonic anhydrase [Actinomycetota bacterium]|nr:carbonic anhydrase [Actinomycetota bacterium]